MLVEALIENLYTGNALTNTTFDHIFDYELLKLENGTKEFSRYNLPILESTFDPYKITLDFIRRLHKKITVVRNAPIQIETIDDSILCYSHDRIIINEFSKNLIEGPLITDTGEYTPLGIYGLLFGRHYSDLYYKTKIEDSLKRLGYKETKFGSKEVFLYEKSSKYNLMMNITKFDNYNRNGELFFWRD